MFRRDSATASDRGQGSVPRAEGEARAPQTALGNTTPCVELLAATGLEVPTANTIIIYYIPARHSYGLIGLILIILVQFTSDSSDAVVDIQQSCLLYCCYCCINKRLA